jgi:transposase
MRARMIELSWSGLRVPAIAAELDCSQKTVRCWLHRFNRSGLQGLEDLGGQGRKRRITVTTGPVCPVRPARRGHSLSRPGYGPPPC